jgi:hypothetical protein
VLVRGAGIVGHLHDRAEHLLGNGGELRLRYQLGPRDRLHEVLDIKGIDLLEGEQRHHQAIAGLGRRQRAAHADHDIEVGGLRPCPQCLEQQVEISWVARPQQIGLQALDRQHPAELAHK